MSETLALLEKCRPYVEECAAEQSGYGFFPGGDPRSFTPDEEGTTDEEFARWKADCEAAERGENADQSPAGETLRDKDGKWLGHIIHGKYGLGVYTYRDEAAVTLLSEIDAALAKARGEGSEP